MSYKSISGTHVCERVVEKSRFLAYAAHTAGEEEARAFLAGVRAEHPLATHVCYGFVADSLGNLQRFSDDGEPQGTAGLPILSVIKAQGLFETAIAVVRYFGGVKLGAGGLTRAYASAAAEAADGAEKCLYDLCRELELRVGYPEVNALLRAAEGRCIVKERRFAEDAALLVQVRAGEAEAFCAHLTEALNGRVQIFEKAAYFSPFPLVK